MKKSRLKDNNLLRKRAQLEAMISQTRISSSLTRDTLGASFYYNQNHRKNDHLLPKQSFSEKISFDRCYLNKVEGMMLKIMHTINYRLNEI